MSLMSDVIKLALAKQVAAQEVLDRNSMSIEGMVMPTDTVAATHGIEKYRECMRDAEVFADIGIRLTGTIPAMEITPGDSSPDGQKAARLVRKVLQRLPGATESVLRDQVFREALITGSAIAEEVQEVFEDEEFGRVMGLKAIKVRMSESFTFDADTHGNITRIYQRTSKNGEVDVPMDRCIVFSLPADADTPMGTSALYAAYPAWLLKEHLFRQFATFIDSNASGIRVAKVKKADFKEYSEKVQQILERISAQSAITIPDNTELDIKIPSGDAGRHFIEAIREVCNKEIRKAILFDETYNAEGAHTGSFASRRVSQSIVDDVMAVQGSAYAECLTEQLVKRILEWNGFSHLPMPYVSFIPKPQPDAEPGPVLASLSQAKTSGLLTIEIPQSVQVDIVRRMVETFGVEWPEEVDKQESPMPEKAPESPQDETVPAELYEAGQKAKALVAAGVRGVLLDSNGTWRPDMLDSSGKVRIGTARKRVLEMTRKGAPRVRQALMGMLPQTEDTPQDVYMALEQFYGSLDASVYESLKTAIRAGLSADGTVEMVMGPVGQRFNSMCDLVEMARSMAGR